MVKIKLLGSLNKRTKKFTPGIRELPHITSRVTCPDTNIVKQICNQALEEQAKGPQIGTYWMDNNIGIHFNLNDLISKRTFIFARAGYGKSNLMKVLASNWRESNGGLVIFDPEGEYAVTDAKGRPGIMDKVPCVLVTNRADLSDKVNVYPILKFNLKDFHPKFIIPILVPENKHETIFFSKLMDLNESNWGELVDYLYEKRWGASNEQIRNIIEGPDSETSTRDLQPMKNNLINPILSLHDPESELLSVILKAIKNGQILIIDISLMDSVSARRFSSMIVGYIFNENQKRFIGGNKKLIKAVFCMEEAQSVLGKYSGISTFIELAKEGRKYSLGGIFITQQPASIVDEILSQADNFFVFHLLSKSDLQALQKANAHYSDDISTQILSEPTKGKSYMWTSHQPFVLPIRIDNFEEMAKPNESKTIQERVNLLGALFKEVHKDDEILLTIAEKYKSVAIIFEDEKKRSKELFKRLSEIEREYCREHNGLSIYEGEEFAIDYKFLKKIKRIAKKE